MAQNPLIQTQFAFADPNASPLTINELIALLNTLVTSQFVPENTYLPYVIGHDQPSVDDQDKAWIETDTVGNPIRINTFVGGLWRRVYNGMKGGEVRGFTGAPGYGPLPDLFDSTGLGNITGEFDGWAICNGNNGTPDLSNRFILGSDMSGASHGFDGTNWVSQIQINGVPTPQGQGGLFETPLTAANIPLPVAPAIKFNHYDATGATVAHGANLFGKDVDHLEGNLVPEYPPAGYAGNDPAQFRPTPTVPPFYSLAYITFVGY